MLVPEDLPGSLQEVSRSLTKVDQFTKLELVPGGRGITLTLKSGLIFDVAKALGAKYDRKRQMEKSKRDREAARAASQLQRKEEADKVRLDKEAVRAASELKKQEEAEKREKIQAARAASQLKKLEDARRWEEEREKRLKEVASQAEDLMKDEEDKDLVPKIGFDDEKLVIVSNSIEESRQTLYKVYPNTPAN